MHHFIAVRRFVPGVLVVVLLGYVAFARAESDEVNYDTAWTFVYDGGRTTENRSIEDYFHGGVVLPGGESVFTGFTRDSAGTGMFLLLKLTAEGTMSWVKKIEKKGEGNAIILAKNGDFMGNRDGVNYYTIAFSPLKCMVDLCRQGRRACALDPCGRPRPGITTPCVPVW